MAAAGDDTQVSISGGGETVETTVGGIREAASRATANVAADQLRSLIERIERLEEEKKTVADDIKSVYGEAKGFGFDTKAMRAIVRIRKLGTEEWEEEQSVLDTYLAALGMLPAGVE